MRSSPRPEAIPTALTLGLASLPSGVVAAAAAPDWTATAPILSMVSVVVVSATAALVMTCVLLHYETLRLLSYRLVHFYAKRRRRILMLVVALLVLAVVKIWPFGAGYYWLLRDPSYGSLHGPEFRPGEWVDHIYFSAVIYATLGLGDLIPSGSIRYLVGTDTLVGFTLISWSAAFTFFGMDRFWRDGTERRHRQADGPDQRRWPGG